jgi:hypothetical protein
LRAFDADRPGFRITKLGGMSGGERYCGPKLNAT